MDRIRSAACCLYHSLCYFVIYSFMGWCLETTYIFMTEGKFTNRGIGNSPFCILYGFCALLLIYIFKHVRNNLVLFFFSSVLVTTILEYITAFIFQTAFGITTWDYSDEMFNLHGRICLKFSIVWGIASVIGIGLLHSVIERIVSTVPDRCKLVISYFIISYFLIILFSTSVALLHSSGIYQLVHILIPAQ